MKLLSSSDRLLGLTAIVLASAALAFWLPADIETGLVEKVRRRVTIGDTLLPTLALGFVILGGALTFLRPRPVSAPLTLRNVAFVAELLLCLVLSFLLMRWAGPLMVEAIGPEAGYRALRDTVPWKYVGFVTGGTVLVAGLMAIAEGRPSWRGLLIGLLACLVLIALYDLPFDDLLLPPNGDV